jgi:hypothetical protein
MTQDKVTDIDAARILKKMGVPLNLPIERKTFSEAYTKHWFALLDAHSKFTSAVGELADGPRAGSLGKLRLVKRRFAGLCKEMQICDAFIGELSGVTREAPGADPVFKTEQDANECALLSSFLTDRATPFAKFWEAAIEAVDAGDTLTIEPGDIPTWLDD